MRTVQALGKPAFQCGIVAVLLQLPQVYIQGKRQTVLFKLMTPGTTIYNKDFRVAMTAQAWNPSTLEAEEGESGF